MIHERRTACQWMVWVQYSIDAVDTDRNGPVYRLQYYRSRRRMKHDLKTR